MGKQGPCYHCGVTSTPLWRNGPPDKPVLCNACGSRWRTKGTLTNYMPLHARLDFIDVEDYRSFKLKTATVKTKEAKLQKRSHSHSSVKIGGEAPHSDLNFQKVVEEDTSNRSSSGSAISYTENSAHFVSRDGCDGTGSAQSTVWDSLVPSRKRTCVNRPKSSSVEKLKMDLYCILHQQQQKSSYLSGTSEEDLLFVSGTPMDSFEIGHGSVLLKHLTAAQEEESEASSLTLDKKTKTLNEVYSESPTHHVSKGSKGKTFSSVADEKDKELAREGVEEAASRDKKCQFKPRVLWSSTSPLISIDLRDAIGFEQFMRLTNEEQQHLKKYLPSTDTIKFPDTLKSMFGSLHLLEAFSSFQQLLLEGIFDLSFPGINAEDSRNLKRLALVNLMKSNWVQYYQQLKVDKQEKTKGGKENIWGPSFFGCGTSSPVKRHGGQNQKFSELKDPELKDTMKSPKLMQKCGSIKLLDTKPPQPNCTDASLKSHYDKPDTDNDGFCFSPRSLFSFTPDRSSCMLDSFQFSAASSEQDLLFDVPSSMCFPQAELLDRGFGK